MRIPNPQGSNIHVLGTFGVLDMIQATPWLICTLANTKEHIPEASCVFIPSSSFSHTFSHLSTFLAKSGRQWQEIKSQLQPKSRGCLKQYIPKRMFTLWFNAFLQDSSLELTLLSYFCHRLSLASTADKSYWISTHFYVIPCM